MLGEVRPATRKSPPLFGITCIHCGAEMTDEFVPELIQRWNTRVTATASIDKEVMEGAFDKERRDVAARLWKHIGKPLFTGQDVEDIIGVQRSDFDVVWPTRRIAASPTSSSLNRSGRAASSRRRECQSR